MIKYIKNTLLPVMGGALLIAGTSIGAGMLSLPVVTSQGGFFPSCMIYIFAWMVMTSTGLLFLEICHQLPRDSNIISMADKFIGRKGKIFSWALYLFLFYMLLVAYITSGSSLISSVMPSYFPINLSVIIFVLLFSIFVYMGTAAVEWANFILMIGLIIAYLLFVFFGVEFVDVSKLYKSNWLSSLGSFSVILISFGYQGTVPSLTSFFKKDIKKTRTAIILGTTIALIIYLIWEFLILGIIPKDDLLKALASGDTAIKPLKAFVNVKSIYILGQFFSFFAITTSFLGVSLGLFDFLSDGFKIQKKGIKKVSIAVCTFLPSTFIAVTYPKIFHIALSYAGAIGGSLLLIFLPTYIAWKARYENNKKPYESVLPGGKSVLIILFVVVVFTLLIELIHEFNRFYN